MQCYIAFLSGIPLGASSGQMENLRRLFIQLGFSQVETFLDSGNVVFETAPVGVIRPLEAQITRHLTRQLGTDIEAFLRTPEELEEIAAHEVFDNTADDGTMFIVFAHDPVIPRVQRELRFTRTGLDEFRFDGREIYWLRRKPQAGHAESPPAIGDILGAPATVRTRSTVQKIVEQYSERVTGSGRFRR